MSNPYDKHYLLEERPHSQSCHADNSETAWKFYFDFWGEALFNKGEDSKITKKKFGGETIISFNTIAGCAIWLKPKISQADGFSMPSCYKCKMPSCNKCRLRIINEHACFSDDEKELFNRFNKRYHSLANFMPLHKNIEGFNLNKNIKGEMYNDFPDKFFADVRSYYLGALDDKKQQKFSYGANGEYFNSFGSGEGRRRWESFVEANYLQPFMMNEDEMYGDFLQLTPNIPNIKIPIWPNIGTAKYLKDAQRDECMKQVVIFLKNAIAIIETRAGHLESAKKQTPGKKEAL